MRPKTSYPILNGSNADVSLQATSTRQLSIGIRNWSKDKVEWQQHAAGVVVYVLHQLAPNSVYRLAFNGVEGKQIKSNPNGEITININPASGNKIITLTKR